MSQAMDHVITSQPMKSVNALRPDIVLNFTEQQHEYSCSTDYDNPSVSEKHIVKVGYEPVKHSQISDSETCDNQFDGHDSHKDPFSATTESDTAQLHAFSATTDNENRCLDQVDIFLHSDLNTGDIKKMQLQDTYLRPIIDYIRDGKLPQSQKLARNILMEQSDFALFDDILFHSRIAKSKRIKLLTQFQLAVPEVMITTILKLYHDSPFGGHGGIQDTMDKVKEHYFFKQLSNVVGDYVKSCHFCQSRKVTTVHTKSTIVAYPTPSEPFQVWEVDLYGPLPISAAGNTYIFTAVDMFTKFLVTFPIGNKDAVTVSSALFKLFTMYGVCDTLISDQGSEFTAQLTREVCKMLDVPQQFTPAFVHHCLGACERIHATLATRMTPYMDTLCRNWEQVLPSVTFAINSAVNSGLGYSPFELLFGQRPKFPLVALLQPPNMTSIPKDLHSFVRQKHSVLKEFREQAKQHATQAQVSMLSRANIKCHPLQLEKNDYVYLLLQDNTGVTGNKLQRRYAGPFVVQALQSPHMVQICDPTTKKVRLVHIDRLKAAYVRAPTPDNYFTVNKSITSCSVSTQTDNVSESPDTHRFVDNDTDRDCINSHHDARVQPRQSARKCVKPIRFRDADHIDPTNLDDFSQTSDSDGLHRIKRILGQKATINGLHYLVHISGEPAENAFWVPFSSLNAKAQNAIQLKPPPTL
ncbi:MAG: integrase [Sedimenticola sp.]